MSLLSRCRALVRTVFGLPIGERGRLAFVLPTSHDSTVAARRQHLTLSEHDGWLRIESRIVRASTLRTSVGGSPPNALLLDTNLGSGWLSLELDEARWVVARIDVPGDLPDDLLVAAIREVATTADRLERLWTGGDRR